MRMKIDFASFELRDGKLTITRESSPDKPRINTQLGVQKLKANPTEFQKNRFLNRLAEIGIASDNLAIRRKVLAWILG